MPSFVTIGLHLSATPLQMQQTLSVYLAAYAVMVLFHGPLSDAAGRRPVILGSLVIYAMAALGCACACSITQLLFFRALQGLSAGAGAVVGRAVVRDCLAGERAQQLMSQVMMAFGLAPAIAPILGGWLESSLGWRAVFLFLLLFCLGLLLISMLYLPESLPPTHRSTLNPRALLHRYLAVLGNGQFWGLSIAIACNFAGFFLYVAAAPVFVRHYLHLGDRQFGWLFVPMVSGLTLGAYLSGRIAGRLSSQACIRFGYCLMAAAALLNLAASNYGSPLLPWSVLPLTMYTTGLALTMPALSLLLLDLFPDMRGMATSLQSFVQLLMAALISGLVAPLLSESGLFMARGMLVLMAIGWVAWRRFSHPTGQFSTSAKAPL
jgi:DHA1 family bicyclomycin/chloramphenicol resistance-like MFS transporter